MNLENLAYDSTKNTLFTTKVGSNHWSGSNQVNSHTVTTDYTDPLAQIFSGNGVLDGIWFDPGSSTANAITQQLRWQLTIDGVIYTDLVLKHLYTLYNVPPASYNQNAFAASFFDINVRFYSSFKIEVKRVGDTNRSCDFRYLYRTI